ncbi:MAG: hybrid sensor histidine kinase/response regulator [Bacteroidetes bacterium]|nr:hybrid sensor histidine kinase/response regulator [Bacteroidota bacterium]
MTNENNEQTVILAVDDNPRNLQLISALLSQCGHKVVVVNSGENALKYLALKQPDLILLDVMMPGMSGYDVIEKIHNNPEWREIPVIFLTAKNEIADLVQGFRLGAVDYITKPFRSEELQMRIRTHLELMANRKLLKKQNEELNRLYAELEQKNQTISQDAVRLTRINAEKDRFFSIIAHDLRAPIAGFLAVTEVLHQNIQHMNPDEAGLFIKTMADSARELNTLLENLLQWSQMQLGSLQPNPESFDIHLAVADALKVLSAAAAQKQLQVENELPQGLMVFADRQMIVTIMRNLLSNAIKFTPRGGRIRIHMVGTIEKKVDVAVSDTGIGMSAQMVEQLFRLDAKVSRKGTEGESSSGLGLILCHDLALRNNAGLSVESETGKGTTFTLSLPASEA